MKRAFTVIFSAVILMLGFAASLAAGTYEDAAAAEGSGDYATALRLYRLAAGQGDVRAQFHLGLIYEMGKRVPQSHVEAAKWLRLAAGQGDQYAQSMLGFMYEWGKGVSQSYTEAAKWYHLAANQGDAMAQSRLGFMYERGQGVPQSHAEAAKWLRLAADQGDDYAQYNLGVMHEREQNYGEAVKWYRLAADQDLAPAQFSLARLYSIGVGVPQNYVRAHMWFNLAAAQGDQNAIKKRDLIARLMSPAQIAEAQTQATEWRPNYRAYDALAQDRIEVLKQKPPVEGWGAASATGFFASLKSAADSETIVREIPTLAEKYGSILGDVQIILKIADLGSKGVIYRAVAGPLGTRQKAVDLCEKIRRVGGSSACFVTN